MVAKERRLLEECADMCSTLMGLVETDGETIDECMRGDMVQDYKCMVMRELSELRGAANELEVTGST